MRHMEEAPNKDTTPKAAYGSEIILSTLNARYMHTAFGLRYLYANLAELQAKAGIY